MYDTKCREDFKNNPNSCVAWWLISSYAYYREGVSLLQDPTFDKMSKYILDNWNSLEHKHKHLVDYEGLSAGSGFAVEYNRFPEGLLRIVYKLIRQI